MFFSKPTKCQCQSRCLDGTELGSGFSWNQVLFHPKRQDISQNLDRCFFSGVWTEQNLEPGFRACFANRAQAASYPPLTQGRNRLSLELTHYTLIFNINICVNMIGLNHSEETWPRLKQAFSRFDTFQNMSPILVLQYVPNIAKKYHIHFFAKNIVEISKFLGTPQPTGSVLVATKRRKVLPVRQNWSHLKTN